MSKHVHFAYKNDGVPTVEIDLSSVAEYLPQPAIDALQMAINRAISPLLTELSSLREVVGRQAKTAISQAERIDGLEDQQAINIQNWGIAFKVINEVRDKVEDLETAPQKAGPGTINQQEKIATYLKKSPKKRAAFGEIRDFLGVSKSRLSQIINGSGFLILQNRHDRRRRLLQLPANF